MDKMKKWLENQKYLPEFMRDFHDQKDLFKAIHSLYQESATAKQMPRWVNSHIYTVDWFLWYMASRGYTLQKCRKELEFRPFAEPPKAEIFELFSKKE